MILFGRFYFSSLAAVIEEKLTFATRDRQSKENGKISRCVQCVRDKFAEWIIVFIFIYDLFSSTLIEFSQK